MAKKILFLALFLSIFILGGCIQPPIVGNDADEHGCIGSAGYSWCEAKAKCIRVWEEDCNAVMPGSDRDEHSCIPSAGYSWCEAKQKCIRSWEEECVAVEPSGTTIESKAKEFCTDKKMDELDLWQVSVFCSDFVETFGKELTFYKYDTENWALEEKTVCPTGSASEQSTQKCKELVEHKNCAETPICYCDFGGCLGTTKE